MNDDSPFGAILIAGWLVLMPVLIYHRIRSQATGERLDRRQEGWFILLTLRPVGLAHMAALIIYMVRYTEPFKSNYDAAQDSFLHWKFAVAPVAVIALLTNLYQGFDIMEV